MSEEKNKNIIYHYCSLEAFYSIITTKSFWLFSLSSSSDLKELTEAKKIIDKVLNEEKYKSINKSDDSRHYEFYSLSCTSERDSALHFNKYADNGKGVCFGIDTDVFKNYLKNTLLMSPYLGYFFFPKIIYDDSKKGKEIKKYLDEKLLNIEQPEKNKAKEYFEMLTDLYTGQDKDILKKKLIYITALSRFKPRLKMKNYKNEFETRMLFCKSQFQLYKDIFENKPDTSEASRSFYRELLEPAKNLNMGSLPEFTVMSGVIRKYIELKMETIWDKRPIEEVILGPICKTDIEEFNEFLKLNDVSCEVRESEIKNRK